MKAIVNIATRHCAVPSRRLSSTSAASKELQKTIDTTSATADDNAKKADQPAAKQARKTQAQLDQELQQKLAAMAGDGGDAGVEYEDGKPVAMKRGYLATLYD